MDIGKLAGVDHCEEAAGCSGMSPGPKGVRGELRRRKPDVFLTSGCFSHLDFIGMKLLNGLSARGAAKLSCLRHTYNIGICSLCSQTTY